jgi:HNH endonuclease/Domain of unknown function (DUF222)
VSSSVLAVAAALREALSGFEPRLLTGADCAHLAEELAATEKACGAARLLAAARAVETGCHKERGFKDGASWLAQQAGSTGNQARQDLETASSLEKCPDTKAALLAGEVSLGQAAEIIRTESEHPGAEKELLPVARQSDLSKLRERARDHRFSASDATELHRKQRRARHFRHWRDDLGMVCFAGALTPEVGIPFIRRLEVATDRARRGARKDGAVPEKWEAAAADAFAAMVSGEGSGRSSRSELVIVCDVNAWRRGHAHPDEVCHLIDGGPVPLALARELGEDAFLKAVLHDGVEIRTVKHFGRYLPAELRTALDLGPVPNFTGARCVDCGSRFRLEYDHVNPVANNGPTAYSNLEARCWRDHREKTERDRQAGLLGRGPP